MFIQLTDYDAKDKIFINYKRITCIERARSKKKAFLVRFSEYDHCCVVRETPEEIMQLIEDAKREGMEAAE